MPLTPMTLSATERVILVTGSTDGIGLETATTLARDPKHLVVVHGRNADKVAKAVASIKSKTGNERVEAIAADFGDLNAVRGMAAEMEQRFPQLHSLVCNAGVLLPVKATTSDGYEATMAVNHLSHFLLASLLMERLKASGTAEATARVVAVSSICHSWEEMDFDDLNCDNKPYEKYEQYSRSKLANMMMAYAMARRLEAADAPVTCNVLEPGVVETKLLRNGGFSGSPVSQGARAPIFLASHPNVEGVSGKYFSCTCDIIGSAKMASDMDDQERLWKISEDMINQKLGEQVLPVA